MTLTQTIQVLNKHRLGTWGLAAVCATVAYFVAITIPTYYSATSSLYVHNNTISPVGEFTYDGYYAQRAAEEYTDTVVGLFDTPEFSRNVLDSVGDAVRKTFPNTRAIKVEKIAPQVVSVKYVSADAKISEAMVVSATTAAVDLVDRLNGNDTLLFDLEVLEAAPDVREISYSPFLVSGVSFWVVMIIASGLLITHTYLSGNDQT